MSDANLPLTIGGRSARAPERMGWMACMCAWTNTSNLPVEALEIEYPLTVLRYERVDGSGGPGRFRGGMGLRRVYRAEAECQLRLDGSRPLTPPCGLLWRSFGRPRRLSVRRRGRAIRWGKRPFASERDDRDCHSPRRRLGPPAERDPAAVERDLADGRIDLPTTPAAIYLGRSSRPQ